jgi:uncharacterized membrane protein YphA (DoxX/SURF4 family)
MNQLSIFPELLTFGMIAPLLLRLGVGYLVLLFGWERFHKKHKWASAFYLIAGVLLILGLYTQIAAILGILIIKFDFWTDRKKFSSGKEHLNLSILMALIFLSLLITGPGFLAFDLPL